MEMEVDVLERSRSDEPAVLQLHSWDNSPLPVSAFAKAAFSPSRELLLLQSHDHEALLLPLGGSSALSPNPLRVPLPDFSCNPPDTPETPLATSRSVSTSSGFDSTPYKTPYGNSLFQTSPATPYFTAPLNPIPTPSSSVGKISPRSLCTLPYPFFCDVDHFAWACYGDGFGSMGPSGVFKEFLFTSNQDSLFIHCFSHAYSTDEKTLLTKERSEPVALKAKDKTGLDEKKRAGKWRNLGQSEVDIPFELRRRFDDYAEISEGNFQQGERQLGMTVDNVEETRGSGDEGAKKTQRPGVESINENRTTESSNYRKGLVSYVVDAELEESVEGLVLRFKGPHWPSSAEVVSFKFAVESFYFSLLKSKNSRGNVESSDPIIPDENRKTDSEKVLDSEELVSAEGSPLRKLRSQILDIISNQSHTLVGIVMNQIWSEAQGPAEQKTENQKLDGEVAVQDLVDKRRPKLEVKGNASVSVALVHDWGIKWISFIDLNEGTSKEAEEIPWASLVLASESLFGLKENGGVFVWSALSGNFVSFIDVVEHCGTRPTGPLGEKPGTDSLLSEKDDEPSSHVSSREESGKSCKEGKEQRVDSQICKDQTERHFTNLVVTANCLLLAVTDDRGILFLVSTDDYFASQASLSSNMASPHLKTCNGQENLKVLSYWDVGGSDIGCSLPTTVLPDRQWLELVHEERRHLGTTGGAFDTRQHAISSGQQTASGIDSGPGPPTGINAFRAATGFTTRMDVFCSGPVNVGRTRCKQPIRRVFLPWKYSKVPVAVALSPYSITTLLRSPENDENFTITQNMLRILNGAVDERDVYERTKERIQGQVQMRRSYVGETLAFCSQGFLYILTSTSLHVVLPPLTVSWSPPAPLIPHSLEQKCHAGTTSGIHCDWDIMTASRTVTQPWQTEVLDRALVCDGLQEAELLCLENGWNLKLLRLRRLQLALDFVQAEDVEQALDALVHIEAAEAGVLSVLFAASELMLNQYGSDSELAQASRLLSLAASFTTGLIRKHGMRVLQSDGQRYQQKAHLSSKASRYKAPSVLSELARFLEVTRSLQNCLHVKRRGPNHRKGESGGDGVFVASDSPYIRAPLKAIEEGNEEAISGGVKAIISSPEASPSHDITSPGTPPSGALVTTGAMWDLSPTGIEAKKTRRRPSLESPGDMFARWQNENVDAAGVVRDALKSSGRLALAVAQLHRLRMNSPRDGHQGQGLQPDDVFSELLQIGRGIVYELFCKGKTALAMAALRRLGEDIETSLRELALGSVRRSLRIQAVKELQRLTRISSNDFQLFERVSLIERVCINSSFRSIYEMRQILLSGSSVQSIETEPKLALICDITAGELKIECGEVDGVVLGSWSMIDDPGVVEDLLPVQERNHSGYWATAAVWLQSWDQLTVDRILLEQPFLEDQLISWEAKLKFSAAHHNWQEVLLLLDMVPPSVLCDGELHIQLDCDDAVACDPSLPFPGVFHNGGSPRHGWSDGVEMVEAVVPKIQVLDIDLTSICSTWMWQLIEERLVKNHIFLRTQWKGTVEVVSLFARAGLLFYRFGGGRNLSSRNKDGSIHGVVAGPIKGSKLQKDAVRGVHELVVHHCVRHTLPHLLELYLDFHSLALDKGSSAIMQALVGDCQWALWLLYSILQRREYDASFANARTILAPSPSPGPNFNVSNMDSFLPTVDDMAEAGGEIMALSTLMYAPVLLQKCLCAGSVSRHEGRSWQCTLESLQPGLQRFPTLWKTLVTACFGHNNTREFAHGHALRAGSKGGLAQYLQGRLSLFSSASGDTSLLQMMPRWLPQRVRVLLQLSIQGPAGGGQIAVQQSLDVTAKVPTGVERVSHKASLELLETQASTWEATIQKMIEEELYAPSSEDTGFGCEHHLRRGRAIAAFNILLCARAQSSPEWKSGHGHLHSSEVQILFSPLTSREEKLLSPAIPLALMYYENPVVVAACTLLIELCGLSANLLRIDIAALIRISKYLKSNENEAVSSSGSTATGRGTTAWANAYGADVTGPLARALADEYSNAGVKVLSSRGDGLQSKQPSEAVLAILQFLEKASLKDDGMERIEGGSPGSWLFSGQGDGSRLRTMQRSMSEHWSLVTAFCRAHQLPLSTTYLAILARDNDWVGFLAEAQLEGCPLDVLLTVVSKEFTDARLKSHLLFILKSLPGASEKSTLESSPLLPTGESPESSSEMETELFKLLADCEHSKRSGKSLLAKAKALRWPLLAVVASCFTDVTPHSCLSTWLEITAVKETSVIQIADEAAQISACVGAAVEATNAIAGSSRTSGFRFSRKSAKRRRRMSPEEANILLDGVQPACDEPPTGLASDKFGIHPGQIELTPVPSEQKSQTLGEGPPTSFTDGVGEQESLAAMVAVLCEQQRFLPLLRAFELFTPASSFLPFLRFLQAFSQMRISEASAHLAAFTARLKEETHQQHLQNRSGKSHSAWIANAAIAAADAMHAACPSAYERRCLLQLLSGSDFGDGGIAAMRYRRLYWKIQLAEPALREGSDLMADGANLDDETLLDTLEKSGQWEQARSWARQLDLSHGGSALHHVTKTQAEAMVTEWKELLWDVPEERIALWNHCQALFTMHAFPALTAGEFFLKHADAVESEVSSSELHNILLLALQWLSGSITNSPPVYPLHVLHELETRVWLLAVESSVETRDGREADSLISMQSTPVGGLSHESAVTPVIMNPVDRTAAAFAVVENHLKRSNLRKFDGDEVAQSRSLDTATSYPPTKSNASKFKRRLKDQSQVKFHLDISEGTASDSEDSPRKGVRSKAVRRNAGKEIQPDGNMMSEEVVSGWEEKVGEREVQRAVLALLEVGQVTAAKQLQQKLSPGHVPLELSIIEAALRVAALASSTVHSSVIFSTIGPTVMEHLQTVGLLQDVTRLSTREVLESLAEACREGCGRGLCLRISAVARISNFLGLTFNAAYSNPPTQLLQLLALKGQDALAEAKLLVSTYSILPGSVARILAEAFLKGLLAAHRGGYTESSQKEEGPAPLLWRSSDFIRWAQVCPSEPEIGHALMRLVISGRDMPHACEVELIILAHSFYESSACLDGVDVLVALAATRVESYVSEGDYSSLARLVTGISNFQALRFMLNLLIENGQLELLLQKRSIVDAAMESSASIRGFRMAVLSALKQFNPHDLDAFTMVYNNFSMAHEMAALLESRGRKTLEHLSKNYDPEQSEESLDTMRFFVEAGEVYSGIDAGNKTRWCCAQASLISLQLRMPEYVWLNLSNDTNARRLLVEQPRFQEALIVAEAYGLNQSAEWVPVIWNQLLVPGRIEQFLNDFVASLPLTYSMLMELARFYRAEVSARGDQSHLDFSKWLTPGGVPVELARHLNKSFRSLLKHTRDMKERLQLATVATGFPDVVDWCIKNLDNMPVTAGPLILRKGHGGTYVPIM